jgi:uncharacterized protein
VFIEIEHLKPEPLHIRHTYGLTDLPFLRRDTAVEEPVVADFTLTHKDRDLRFEGSVRTRVRCECSRCLREFSQAVDAQFNLFYLPHPEGIDEEEEIELKYEDLDVGFYDGLKFDVDAMISEQIDLTLPMKLVCAESCKGLCATCGSDLNAATCRCAEEVQDPRLAALLEFRKKMKREDTS